MRPAFAIKRSWRWLAAAVLALAIVPVLAACSGIGYYAHLARGQYALLAARRPIVDVVADPATPAALRGRLEQAQAARAFASDVLQLPRNGSYTNYADLHRSYVVKNVFAAPEFSLVPVEHCFPIAGCVAYRGYYDVARAEAEAQRLKAKGYEVYIGNVPAYSTLGWFDDPVLNTMLQWDDDELAGTIFHELGHQRLYVKGDTAFNESFATFIEQQGLRQWRAARGLPPGDSQSSQRSDAFTALILSARTRLQQLYASGEAPDAMRRDKQAEIERLRGDYRTLRDGPWHGYSGYDAWMNAEINNAKLLPFGLYHQWLPSFAALFAQAGGDWRAFYAAAKTVADLTPAARQQRLQALADAAINTAPQPVAAP